MEGDKDRKVITNEYMIQSRFVTLSGVWPLYTWITWVGAPKKMGSEKFPSKKSDIRIDDSESGIWKNIHWNKVEDEWSNIEREMIHT